MQKSCFCKAPLDGNFNLRLVYNKFMLGNTCVVNRYCKPEKEKTREKKETCKKVMI